MLKLIKKSKITKKPKVPKTEMWLLVGLGNPGDGYKHNRHNIGFMAVDEIAAAHKFSIWRKKFEGLFAEGEIDGRRTVLLKPQTYMNNSGQSVKAAVKFFKIDHERVVVFHDELDLSPGRMRVKYGGGNAGHNGLKSIEAHLGSADYWRVRLGIGHPGEREKVHGHVLKDFAKGEKSWLDPLLSAVGAHAPLVVNGEISVFTNKVMMTAPAPGAAATPEQDDDVAPPKKAARGRKKEK